MNLPDMQELVHSARVVFPGGRIEEMFFVYPSDVERLLRESRQQAKEIERLRAVLAAAKAFVAHVPPTDCVLWTCAEMQAYCDKRLALEAALEAAVVAAEGKQ